MYATNSICLYALFGDGRQIIQSSYGGQSPANMLSICNVRMESKEDEMDIDTESYSTAYSHVYDAHGIVYIYRTPSCSYSWRKKKENSLWYREVDIGNATVLIMS